MNINRCLKLNLLNRSINVYNGHYRSIRNCPLLVNNFINQKQLIRLTSTCERKIEKDESAIRKILQRIPFLKLNKNQLKIAGYYLYEAVADKIKYADFFEEFDLPDTFYSWFVVTELHLWMISVRAMAEGEDGRIVRNSMLEALWSDVAARVKKVGALGSDDVKEQVYELSEQLQAALIAYDEGLQSNDKILAGAIWRRIYQYNDIDIRHLDKLIHYIRKHIRILDNLGRDDLVKRKAIVWESCKTFSY